MIHSGSRNLGSRVADYYNKSAKELNAKWFSSVQSKKDLAFLPLDYQEAQEYIIQMEFCVEFALANRKVMMDKVLGVLAINVGRMIIADSDEMINIAHNYARQENHFGSNVWVHRKGATSARKGELGIIPGSQGSKSYIVRGLGNKDSFESCSHGAGRVMGRKEAKRKLDLEKEIKILDEQDIVHGIRNINDLDEATSAYKNIEQVMTNQSDLVEVVTELFPILSIKG